MRCRERSIGLAMILVMGAASLVLAGGHGDEPGKKTGILLVAFGTSVPRAQVSFSNIETRVKTAFPGIPVRWAYTSSIIRRKLARQGEMLDSPEVAMAKMMDEGFTHLGVQSLHTIPGEEYHDLRRNVGAFSMMAGGFERILLGDPLLAREDDLIRVTDAMIRNIPRTGNLKTRWSSWVMGPPIPATLSTLP